MTADPHAKELRAMKKEMRDLTQTVDRYLALLDETMRGPSTVERGKRIAELSNQLDMQNQRAKRFGLGIIPKGGR